MTQLIDTSPMPYGKYKGTAMLVFGRDIPEVLLKGFYDSKINESK